jgi:uncharacterized protein
MGALLPNSTTSTNSTFTPMRRRAFLKKSFWTLATTGIVSGLYAWQIEPFWLEFVRLKMPVKNLPDELKGKTLMQISDLHVGKRFDYRYLIESLKKAAAFEPDFVVYTGDYVSTYKDEVQYDLLDKVLQNLVKGRLGTIGILGNHDYGKNWMQPQVADKIADMLSLSGVQMLRNQSVAVNGLHFIGMDDLWGMNFEPTVALQAFDPSKANIALCHNPDVCDMNVWGAYDSWILSGHTHGGQCKPPFLPPPLRPVKNVKYVAGLVPLSNDRTLYVNRALGHLWQVRFNVRPEITIFELTKA